VRTVEVSSRAAGEIQRACAWWFENRTKAPWAFVDELEAAFNRLELDAGTPPVIGPGGFRRTLLGRVRYHLYYRIRDEHTVDVLSVWQSNRRPPAL
jgi:plasmid stabilization system protein ParE